MKILLVVDGSKYSDAATKMVKALRPPPEAEVTVMTVVPEHTFLGGITLPKLQGTRVDKDAQQQRALELVRSSAQALDGIRAKVETMVRWGDPAEEVLKESNGGGVSLVIMGARGLTDPLPFRLSSVAQTVMKHVRASVLLVRENSATTKRATSASSKTATINRVLLATDGSKHSDVVTQFLINLPLPRSSQAIVVTALQSHLEAWVKTPTLDFQTNKELLAKLQEAEENQARKITANSERQFQNNGYKTRAAIVRGGVAECILAAAKEFNPDIIALGSRGLTSIESFLLGSVAERVARYANCSVLIGRATK